MFCTCTSHTHTSRNVSAKYGTFLWIFSMFLCRISNSGAIKVICDIVQMCGNLKQLIFFYSKKLNRMASIEGFTKKKLVRGETPERKTYAFERDHILLLLFFIILLISTINWITFTISLTLSCLTMLSTRTRSSSISISMCLLNPRYWFAFCYSANIHAMSRR